MVPMRTHCTVLWAISLAFLMLGTGRVEGETILIDDFSDGNDDGWSHFGLDLTGGEAWGSGTFDATSLNYRLEGSGAVPKREQGTLFSLWDGSAHTSFTDGFMRATVRADSDALVYLLMRANTETVSAYIFGADPSTEEFFFHKVENSQVVEEDYFFADEPFVIGDDWIIEAGAVADELSMKVWRPGEGEPPEPQWTFAEQGQGGDPIVAPGSGLATPTFGVGANHATGRPPAPVSATFDDIFFTVVPAAPAGPVLHAGDADQDLDFDQLDLATVWQAGKYLTGQPATWGEGDWNGAPGGSQGNPPPGDDLFNQLDIVAALYEYCGGPGPYAAIHPNGMMADGQTSIGYDATTGDVWVDAPAGTELTSINIDSAAGIFTRDAAENLGGLFDNDSGTNIFKATFFGSRFGSVHFGKVARPGLEENFLLNDLSVVGSLECGTLGDVDLIYVPELLPLQAGDADQDFDFDQLDLVRVQIAAKYLTGEPATWGDGDWDGAPGGSQGNPPAGDGLFNQLDVVAAQQAGTYLTGAYAAIQPNGQQDDFAASSSLEGGGELGDLGLMYIPEPSSVVLLSLGLIAALGRRRAICLRGSSSGSRKGWG